MGLLIVLLSFAATFQIFFAPGLLIYFFRKSKPTDFRLSEVLLSSISANILITVLMTALGFPIKNCLWFFLGLEVLLFIYFLFTHKTTIPFKKPNWTKLDPVDFLLIVFVLQEYSNILFGTFRFFFEPFLQIDAASSWGPWGVDWYNGVIPHAYYYSQGIPIFNAIAFSIVGNPVYEFAARNMCAFLYLFHFLAWSFYAMDRVSILRKGILGYLLAFQWLVNATVQSHWRTGYADVPLACIASLAYLAYIQNKSNAVAMALPSYFKQTGLIFTFVYPFLKKNWKRHIKWEYFLSCFLSGVYFIFIFLRSRSSQKSASNLDYLTNLAGSSWVSRLENGWRGINHSYHSYEIVILAILVLFGLRISRNRRLMLFWGLPALGAWWLFLSYDMRNLTNCFFPFAIVAGSGMGLLGHSVSSWIKKKTPAFFLRHSPTAILVVFWVMTILPFISSVNKWKENLSGNFLQKQIEYQSQKQGK